MASSDTGTSKAQKSAKPRKPTGVLRDVINKYGQSSSSTSSVICTTTLEPASGKRKMTTEKRANTGDQEAEIAESTELKRSNGQAQFTDVEDNSEIETVFAPAAELNTEICYRGKVTLRLPASKVPTSKKVQQPTTKKVRFLESPESAGDPNERLLAESLRRNIVRDRRRELMQREGVVAFHQRLAGRWWEESDSDLEGAFDSDSAYED